MLVTDGAPSWAEDQETAAAQSADSAGSHLAARSSASIGPLALRAVAIVEECDEMRQTLALLIFVGITTLGIKPIQAQTNQNLRAWWAGGEIGEGQLKLASDQIHRDRKPTFALGFFGGHRLGDQARIGLEMNGWLLQAFNLNDPTVGESVSNVLGVIDVFPARKIPLFFRAGGGLAMYQNNRAGESGGTGWSWTGGAGYEIRASERLGLAPIVAYAYGRFDDVRNPITVQTGRHYSVLEFKVAAIWHFGRRPGI